MRCVTRRPLPRPSKGLVPCNAASPHSDENVASAAAARRLYYLPAHSPPPQYGQHAASAIRTGRTPPPPAHRRRGNHRPSRTTAIRRSRISRRPNGAASRATAGDSAIRRTRPDLNFEVAGNDVPSVDVFYDHRSPYGHPGTRPSTAGCFAPATAGTCRTPTAGGPTPSTASPGVRRSVVWAPDHYGPLGSGRTAGSGAPTRLGAPAWCTGARRRLRGWAPVGYTDLRVLPRGSLAVPSLRPTCFAPTRRATSSRGNVHTYVGTLVILPTARSPPAHVGLVPTTSGFAAQPRRCPSRAPRTRSIRPVRRGAPP